MKILSMNAKNNLFRTERLTVQKFRQSLIFQASISEMKTIAAQKTDLHQTRKICS